MAKNQRYLKTQIIVYLVAFSIISVIAVVGVSIISTVERRKPYNACSMFNLSPQVLSAFTEMLVWNSNKFLQI